MSSETIAYSEFIFTKTCWPDFTPKKLVECLKEYENFKINHDLCIERIIQNKQKVLNSGIKIV